MQKFQLDKIVPWISAQILLQILLVEAQWCPYFVPVQATRLVVKDQYRMVTKNVDGFYTSDWERYPGYPVPEFYETQELRSGCCGGYIAREDECEPVCEPPCLARSHCQSPNLCQCDADYAPASDEQPLECRPICYAGCPLHSTCSAPNQCTCNSGYEGDNCAPVCLKGCPANSACAAPERCECNIGYMNVTHTASAADAECQPICASACGANSRCVAPNECRCVDGYEMDVTTRKCMPRCTLSCPAHSNCAAPDECHCEDGYRMNETSRQCEPICGQGCMAHSFCSRPAECRCDEGYRKAQQPEGLEFCEPICEQNCSAHSRCRRPGVCECLAGYEITKNDSALCSPRCSQGCMNGFCFAPETCVCDPGYRMGANATCVPVCSLGCTHGECVEPEICRCAPGYQLQANSVNLCEPVCEPGCENADCVAPNRCVCWNRYQAAVGSSSACVPVCPSECLHGYCNASFQCSCHEGYQPHLFAPNECVPICGNCKNGRCVTPTICQCLPGYEVTLNTDPRVPGPGASCELPRKSEIPTGGTEATTTVAVGSSDSENSTDLLATEHCQSRCRCWSKLDEMELFNTVGCHQFCADGFDQPCLDLQRCRCIQRAGSIQLLCARSDSATSAEQDSRVVYTCVANRSPWLWWIVAAAVACILVVVATICLIRRRVRSRPQPRKTELNVGFHSAVHKL